MEDWQEMALLFAHVTDFFFFFLAVLQQCHTTYVSEIHPIYSPAVAQELSDSACVKKLLFFLVAGPCWSDKFEIIVGIWVALGFSFSPIKSIRIHAETKCCLFRSETNAPL